MSDKKLLTEWLAFSYSPELIKEARSTNGGKIMLKGIIQKAETLNQNGRIYPRPILEREVRNYQKFIKENRALGECDHPETSVVELKNTSHIMREVYMEGDTVYGSIEVLDTPSGKIIQSLVESGVTIGISSRGVGSTKQEGSADVVQDDYVIICWDLVSEPSTPSAFMMREGKISESALRKQFKKSDRVSRIYNDVLDWKGTSHSGDK